MPSKTVVASQSKINLVKLYKSILILLLICGFDFNVWKFKLLLKICMTLYCIFLITVNIITNFTCCPGQELPVAWSVVEYTATVILTLVFKNQIANYFEKLTDLDIYLKIGNKYYINSKTKMFYYTFVLWLIRFIYTILYWIWFPYYENVTLFVISQFSLIALDLNRVWRFVLFDMTRYRLKKLRRRVEELNNFNFFCYVSNFKTLKQSRIRFCLYLYKNLADAVDVIMPELHASLFISMVCTLPKLILNAYHILLVIENLEPYSTAGFAALHVTQVTLFIFAPCVVVELYAVEVERMQLLLVHKLLDDPDETVKEDVNLFLRYTEVRPFRFYLWRVVPVSIMLPLELLSLCTTYVIVLINFTHLYG
ncbi:uncharacterized protein LOC133534459 [Cydia pomonella]|uniref:uncharacterized protein LOC133534459 n=1 Tax=Cydia pomonella TaxID=82600 RepID=UPI002ADDF83C|nr:uncharacterized protein LOC133534459 [Cydia pomonella]